MTGPNFALYLLAITNTLLINCHAQKESVEYGEEARYINHFERSLPLDIKCEVSGGDSIVTLFRHGKDVHVVVWNEFTSEIGLKANFVLYEANTQRKEFVPQISNSLSNASKARITKVFDKKRNGGKFESANFSYKSKVVGLDGVDAFGLIYKENGSPIFEGVPNSEISVGEFVEKDGFKSLEIVYVDVDETRVSMIFLVGESDDIEGYLDNKGLDADKKKNVILLAR